MAAFQLIVAEVAMMLLLTISLVNYYKSPSVSWDVWLATYVSWVLGFAGTVLLPFDMAVTLAYSDDEQYKTLNSVWRAIYWRSSSSPANGIDMLLQHLLTCMDTSSNSNAISYVWRIFIWAQGERDSSHLIISWSLLNSVVMGSNQSKFTLILCWICHVFNLHHLYARNKGLS
jgi:hypothetical protein